MTLDRVRTSAVCVVVFLSIILGTYSSAGGRDEPVLPMVAAAAVPLYPPFARQTNTQGAIHVQVSTDGHKVTAAHAQEDLKPLSTEAEDNAKTWTFATHTPVTFTITYVYVLSERCRPNNPTVTLRLPTEVEVCQYPFHLY